MDRTRCNGAQAIHPALKRSRVSLSTVLERLMQRPNYRYTPGLLSRLSGVPKTTIVNWLIGRVTRPRHWQDLVMVAGALRLSEAEVDELLDVAGHPPIAVLLTRTSDPAERQLLGPWQRSETGTPTPGAGAATLAPPVLPVPTAPLIGRDGERERAAMLLTDPAVRLLTLTGPAGAGKTRLALQIAADLGAFFADGVYFAGLTPLSEPAMVVPTIARTLGIAETGARSPAQRVVEALQHRHMLLILDNYEHLLAATPAISELLAATPGLTVLVTSRVVLHIAGEHELALPPLELPDLVHLPPPAQLAKVPAVALFLARVRTVKPDFQLTAANAAAVAAICVRLDGLPLALELAAARSKLLPPRELLARLDQRLSLLTVVYTDRPSHQQTLRGTLDWSYRLLPQSAQRLFARVAVFVGGWSLAAAETICADAERQSLHLERQQILDGLMTLADHSLVQTADGEDEQRYALLETMRAYALELLVASGEQHVIAARHAAYYQQLAETAGPALSGPEQVHWLNRLDQEHDNLRAALGWALQHEPDQAARIATAIWFFWMLRGYLQEGRRWLEQIAPLAEPQLRAAALLGAGRLARQQGDLEAAAAHLTASLSIQRGLGNQQGEAIALGYLGVVAYDRGDFARAEALHRESLALRHLVGDHWGIAATLTNLGEVARQQGDTRAALTLQGEALTRFRELGDRVGSATALLNIGMLELLQGRHEAARPLLQESLALWVALDEQVDIAECLEGLAAVAADAGEALRAARLAGAATAAREAAGSLLSPTDQQRLAPHLDRAAAQLGPAAFAAAWNEGRAWRLAEAVAEAQNERATPPTQ